MPSRKTRWDEPVEMALNSDLQKIEGPFDALKYLTESWPADRGMSFVKARSACRAALAGIKRLRRRVLLSRLQQLMRTTFWELIRSLSDLAREFSMRRTSLIWRSEVEKGGMTSAVRGHLTKHCKPDFGQG